MRRSIRRLSARPIPAAKEALYFDSEDPCLTLNAVLRQGPGQSRDVDVSMRLLKVSEVGERVLAIEK